MLLQTIIIFTILLNTVAPDNKDWYNSDYHDDEVKSLPGLNPPPKFKQYSGYLKTDSPRLLHYWFLDSENSPDTDPVVLWLNGGPGCSSMDGLFTENGPYRIPLDGSRLDYAEYSWNKVANMLYLEAPAGVGFSFSEDGNITTDDEQVARDNHMGLRDFFRKFSHLSGRPFFLSGESYAGIYIPTLMVRLKHDPSINMKGALIGNGYMQPALLEDTKFPYWYYHGIIDTTAWDKLQDACCTKGNRSDCQYVPFRSEECKNVVGDITVQVASTLVNPYFIYGTCEGTTSAESQRRRTASILKLILKQIMSTYTDKKLIRLYEDHSRLMAQSAPCTDSTNMENYLNRQEVQKALHVNRYLPRWIMCSSLIAEEGENPTYTRLYDTMAPQFKDILENKAYHLLVFNGDLDTVCNFFGDEIFVEGLGLKELSTRKPWYYTSVADGSRQIGGFAHHYDHLTYITVKGAGHMVPTDQPVAAYKMFTSFINAKQSSANENIFLAL